LVYTLKCSQTQKSLVDGAGINSLRTGSEYISQRTALISQEQKWTMFRSICSNYLRLISLNNIFSEQDSIINIQNGSLLFAEEASMKEVQNED